MLDRKHTRRRRQVATGRTEQRQTFDGVLSLNLEQVKSRAASSLTHVTYRLLPCAGPCLVVDEPVRASPPACEFDAAGWRVHLLVVTSVARSGSPRRGVGREAGRGDGECQWQSRAVADYLSRSGRLG